MEQLLTAPANPNAGPTADCFGVIVSTLKSVLSSCNFINAHRLTIDYLFISRVYDESLHWSVVNEVLFKCVVENDLTGVKTYVESGENINATNEEVSFAR